MRAQKQDRKKEIIWGALSLDNPQSCMCLHTRWVNKIVADYGVNKFKDTISDNLAQTHARIPSENEHRYRLSD